MAAASRNGLAPADLVRKLVVEHLPVVPADSMPEDATLALFARWEAEDGTDDSDEIETRTREWEELKTRLDAGQVSL